MGIRGITGAHLLHGGSEQAIAVENIRILRKKAEDQPRHEVVHRFPAIVRVPVRVIFQQFDVETIQPPRRLDIKGIFPNLLDRRDAR